MRCINSHKKIKQTQVVGTWYHKKTRGVYCEIPQVATPMENKVSKAMSHEEFIQELTKVQEQIGLYDE